MKGKTTTLYNGDYGKLSQLQRAIVEHHAAQRQRQLYALAEQWDAEQIQDTREPLGEPIRE